MSVNLFASYICKLRQSSSDLPVHMLYFAVFPELFFYFIFDTVCAVTSQDVQAKIYVSQATGNDSSSCGAQSFPCKTISRAVERAPSGGTIYLDGTDTILHPYNCEPLTSQHLGIYVNKSLAFVGFYSRVHIMCKEDQNWLLDGTVSRNPVKVNFSELSFQRSRLYFQDVSMDIKRCAFVKSPTSVINVKLALQKVLTAVLNYVVFERNGACISISSTEERRTQVAMVVVVKNSVFNGDGALVNESSIAQASVLYINTQDQPSALEIQMNNVTFTNNPVNGMVYVQNNLGLTKLSLENNTIVANGMLANRMDLSSSFWVIQALNVLIDMLDTQILRNTARMLYVTADVVNVTLSGTNVVNNTNEPSQGGVLYIRSKSLDLSIGNCYFDNVDSSSGQGGAGYLTADKITLNISGSQFYGHKSGVGGVFYIAATSLSTSISNSSFSRNFVEGYGSVFIFNLSPNAIANVVLQNCDFNSNVAFGPGGAIVLSQGRKVTLNINKVRFYKCSSSGGPIHGATVTIDSSSEVELLISSTVFDANSVFDLSPRSFGGVIGLSGNKPGLINLTANDVLFSNNKIPHSTGGAFYLQTNCKTFLNFYKVRFVNNYSGQPGGAIFVSCAGSPGDVDLTISNCQFKRNKQGAINTNKCESRLSISNTVFELNFSDFPGGGVFVEELRALFIVDSIFMANTAMSEGGALSVTGRNSSITIANTEFLGCSSSFEGGAVFIKVRNDSEVSIKSSLFKNNTAAAAFGGAIHVDMSEDRLVHSGCRSPNPISRVTIPRRSWAYKNVARLEETLLEENFASEGGAFSVRNGKTIVRNCTFLNNFAAAQGGHLSNYGSSSLNISDSYFLQTAENKRLVKNRANFPSSFIQTYSAGPLFLENTLADFRVLTSPSLLATTSRGGLVDFDNLSSVVCPTGSELSILDLSYSYPESETCTRTVTVLRFSCAVCEIGSYSLQRGRSVGLRVGDDFQCLPCPYGADCSRSIVAKPNFWGFEAGQIPPKLKFIRCPLGYCQSPHRDSTEYNGCHGNRVGVLCGDCKPRYTEALFSTECQLKNHCSDNWFWIASLILVSCMALYLISKPPVVTIAIKQVLWFKSLLTLKNEQSSLVQNSEENQEQASSEEQTEFLSNKVHKEKTQSSGFLKIVFYFYQVSNLLLISTSAEVILKTKIIVPVIGIFNFQQKFSGSGDVCPFSGLNAVTKQFFETTFVFATVGSIYGIYGLHWLVNRVLRRGPPHLGPYLGATMETMLLGYATLANVSLRLIRCVRIESDSRLFSSAEVVCFQWWQYALMSFIGVFVVPFIFVLAWGSIKMNHGKMTAKWMLLACVLPLPFLVVWLIRALRRENETVVPRDSLIETLQTVLHDPFRKSADGSKAEALYWESVLIGRRFVLLVLHSSITEPMMRLFCMALVCAIILLHQVKIKPFRDEKANCAESVSLACLVALATINMAKASTLTLATEPKGPVFVVFTMFEWTEILLLGFMPALFFFIVVLGLASLTCRLVFVFCRSIIKVFSRALPVFQHWSRADATRPLLNRT